MSVVKKLGSLPELSFEYMPMAQFGKELRVDAWLKRDERPEAIEFSHYKSATEAVIASYVLEKLREYARDYNLIDF